MLRNNALAIGIWLMSLMGASWAAPTREIVQVDQLISSGEHEEAIDTIRRLEQALPAPERVTAWELDFQGEVVRVANGRQCLYYQLHLSNASQNAPGRQGALESVNANHSRSDRQYAVVCVDLDTGNIRWSRNLNGLAYLATDLRTDTLYLFRERLLALSPDTGEVIEQQELPDSGRGIQGLLLGQVLALSRAQGKETVAPDAELLLYDPKLKLAEKVKVGNYRLLSPDESCRLIHKSDGWEGARVPDGKTLWSWQTSFAEAKPVLWIGSNPVFITGTERQRGAVTTLDIATGEPLWSVALGWGAYTASDHQLRGGGYSEMWTPLAALDQYLLALDGSGRFYFLEPANGRRVASPQLARHFLAMPFQYGEQLIVSTFTGIRSYSIANLIDPHASVDAALQVREGRCLLALGQAEESLTLLDRLVERVPHLRAAWVARADACKTLGHTEEESFSRCQALALSGETHDETLLNRWGLQRLYDLGGKPSWSLAQTPGRVYAGTLVGTLWYVQADTLDFGLTASLDHEITQLESTTQLQAVLGNSTRTRKLVSAAPEPPDDRIPREWHTIGGELRIGPAFSYRGRQFRSLRGGGVRILNGTKMTDLPPLLKDVDEWSIHLSPSGTLGYGKGGVLELDDDLRPVRWIIRLAVNGNTQAEWPRVLFVASRAASIGLIKAGSDGASLQVYSRQGVLLNEAALDRYVSGWAEREQLIPMANGYLFSDRQLVWVSAAKDRRVWRFGPSWARTSGDRWGDRWRYFGYPLLANGCLFVTGLDGCLYVFDSARVTDSGS